MGEEVARSLIAPHVREHITLGTGHSLVELVPGKAFVGRTIAEIDFRAKYGVNIIAIEKRIPRVTERGESTYDVKVNDLPSPNDRIEEGDILVVVGSNEKIADLTEKGED
jgi:trk system potassium uptake protein TrkA